MRIRAIFAIAAVSAVFLLFHPGSTRAGDDDKKNVVTPRGDQKVEDPLDPKDHYKLRDDADVFAPEDMREGSDFIKGKTIHPPIGWHFLPVDSDGHYAIMFEEPGDYRHITPKRGPNEIPLKWIVQRPSTAARFGMRSTGLMGAGGGKEGGSPAAWRVALKQPLDLVIDSDNNDGFDIPKAYPKTSSKTSDQGALDAQDKVEMKDPGKIIGVNTDDSDADADAKLLGKPGKPGIFVNGGIPDWADGFNRYENTDADIKSAKDKFVPMVVRIHKSVDLSKAKLRFVYDDSNPAQELRDGEGNEQKPFVYKSPADLDGSLRIWLKDAKVARNYHSAMDSSKPGDYVPSCDSSKTKKLVEYKNLDKIFNFNLVGEFNEAIIYVEALKPSKKKPYVVRVELDPDGDGDKAGWDYADEVKVGAREIKIVMPRNKENVGWGNYNKIFTKTAPYCYEYQGVATDTSYGDNNKKRVRAIRGGITPAIPYEWFFKKNPDNNGNKNNVGGTITPNEGDTSPSTPIHAPPKKVNAANKPLEDTLVLRLRDYKYVKDTRIVEIYKDHLARDVANFLDGKSSNPVTLSDNSKVYLDENKAQPLILGCSTSFVHAHKGEKGNAHKLWKNLREKQKWIENIGQKYKWGPNANHRTLGYRWKVFTEGKRIKLKWNDKVWLGKKNNGKLVMLHPSTVITEGNGSTAKTYSADNLTHKFRHETVKDYYDMLKKKGPNFEVPIPKRRVWILQPPTKNKEDTENE